MKVHELRALLDSVDNGDLVTSQLVMVFDRQTSLMYRVTGVKSEEHEDGSETVWIEVEEE